MFNVGAGQRRLLVGYAVIGTFTFAIDLGLLAILRDHAAIPLPLAISAAYVTAFAINYLLNRRLNFRSHAPVGFEALRYTAVVALDYTLTLGVTTGLNAEGVDFRIARLTAAGCVAAASYLACRYWVFSGAGS